MQGKKPCYIEYIIIAYLLLGSTNLKLVAEGVPVLRIIQHTITRPSCNNRQCDAKRKKDGELWTAVSGLLALISRAYHNFSLWHHEFIKAKFIEAKSSAALVVLNMLRLKQTQIHFS